MGQEVITAWLVLARASISHASPKFILARCCFPLASVFTRLQDSRSAHSPPLVVWRRDFLAETDARAKEYAAEPDHWSQRRQAPRVCLEVAGCLWSSARRGSVPALGRFTRHEHPKVFPPLIGTRSCRRRPAPDGSRPVQSRSQSESTRSHRSRVGATCFEGGGQQVFESRHSHWLRRACVRNR